MDKKYLIRLLSLIFVIVLAAFMHSCRENQHTQMEIALDTIIEIKANAPNKIPVKKIVNEAFERIRAYEAKFSYYDTESELYQINNSDKEQFQIDEDWFSILSLAKEVYVKTDSLYDVSIGNLTDIWDFENEEIPDRNQIEMAKNDTGFSSIHFTQDSLFISPAIKLTFGSIAKGFIIDKIAAFLQESGITSATINAGGDIRMFGQKKPIKVGIKHPRREGLETIDVLHLQNTSVVTTGDYERYFIQNGERYHHIINPQTGNPSATMISITVIHPLSFIADAYSTGLFLLAPEKAIQLADSIENMSIIIYVEENDEIIKMTSNGVDLYEK